MRKKLIFSMLLVLICISLTGCLEGKVGSNYKITTTYYPIEYLVNRLYGYNSEISSIYPNETDVDTYELKDKQVKEYAKGSDLFIYAGLTKEKEIARTFVDMNKNIQIIDVTFGIINTRGIEEFWLSPNKYLMLADTVKNNLEEILNNTYTNEEIDKNYALLQEDVSLLDAELRSIGKNAISNNNNIFAIVDPAFGFLEEYGYQIIDISDESHVTSNVKNKFKDGTYKYILVSDEKQVPDYVKDLVDNYGTNLITINVMNTLTDEERTANDTYLSIMKNFLSTLSNLNTSSTE